MKKTLLLTIILLFQFCGYKLSSTTNIVDKQTDIAYKISNNEEFDINLAIEDLSNEFMLNSFTGINPVNKNNIAIRNHLVLSMLFYLKNDPEQHLKEYNLALQKLKHNLINDSIYAEGPSYYLYVEEIIDIYLKIINDEELKQIKFRCNNWISKYIMPDGTLAPVGDTRRSFYKEFENYDRIVYDSEETFFKKDNISLFIRHPSKLDKYKLNGHIHYDIGDFVLYNNDKCIILPVGYPGFEKKSQYNLDNLRYKNSIYFEDLSNWRIRNYEQIEVSRTDSSLVMEYRILSKTVTREFIIKKNKLIIRDHGSDGINLNISDDFRDFKIITGSQSLETLRGYHSEMEEEVKQNDILYVSNSCGITEVEITLNN